MMTELCRTPVLAPALAPLGVTLVVALAGGCGAAGPRTHRHGPSTNTDPNSLFVEVWTRGGYEDALRSGARDGLGRVRFARTVDGGGEIELEAEVTRLDRRGSTTACSVKVLVIRLPQHDLLGVADGSAQAGGTDHIAVDDCIRQLTMTLVRGKVSTLLTRRLDAKR